MSDPNPRRPNSSQTLGDKLNEVLLQADTFGRSASNIVTGGLADNAEAAWAALFDKSPGDWPVASQVRKVLPNQRATIVDHVTGNGVNVEAKFGPKATLSPNQKSAQQLWGPDYRVDRWMPYHVGALTAPAGTVGGLLSWGTQQPLPSDGDDDSAGQGGGRD